MLGEKDVFINVIFIVVMFFIFRVVYRFEEIKFFMYWLESVLFMFDVVELKLFV